MSASLSPELKANLSKLDGYLARFKTGGIGHFISGARTDGAESFDVASPVDNQTFCQAAAGSADDIDRAAQAAHDVFADWRATPGKRRREILHAVADAVVANAEEIALLESFDTGQPLRFMQKAALRGAENFRFFADKAPEAANGLSTPSDTQINFTVRQPIGPVGVITPWNTPFMLSTWKIAPALAAGCTVVHKPAEWSPVTATRLVEIMHEAGLPPGVVNTVHGIGEVAGKALTEHPLIKAIAFVGESATGSAIMKQGADTLKRVHFELGGKNPVMVFADADLERALDAAVFMIYSLNGERCTSSSRVLVERSIYHEFSAKLAERARQIHIGHPLDPATELGPLIHPRHLEKVTSYFQVASDEGVEILAGGKTPDAPPSPGNYVEATLFAGAVQDMRVANEEIFGPVLTAIPFEDEDEGLAIANAVPYGLAGYVWTNDTGRALRMAQGMEAGMIWVNSENVRHLPTPFGGMKASGIGRDGGDYSFDFYMETKNIALATGAHKIPKLGA
ncbi:MAG: 5-carboxymethyl-2-hydroxymuconate semialdehyde dehydrogenase [Pseudomonadota bacterium]